MSNEHTRSAEVALYDDITLALAPLRSFFDLLQHADRCEFEGAEACSIGSALLKHATEKIKEVTSMIDQKYGGMEVRRTIRHAEDQGAVLDVRLRNREGSGEDQDPQAMEEQKERRLQEEDAA